MRRLFRLIFQLIATAIFLFLCLAAVVVFDGLSDKGEKADCALVTDLAGAPRVIKLYNDGDVPVIIVSGARVRVTTDVSAGTLRLSGHSTDDEADDIAKNLESQGISANAIIVDHHEDSTPETFDNGAEFRETIQRVAEIMKSHSLQSVMIVTDYYHVTRIKLGLLHEGIKEIGNAHVGALQKEDALKIGREVVALCDYVGHVYLLPAAEKAKEEAKVGMDKATVDAQQARDKVNKSLDNMAK